MMEYYLVTKRHETVTDTGTATTLHCLKAEWEQDNKNRTKKKKRAKKVQVQCPLIWVPSEQGNYFQNSKRS